MSNNIEQLSARERDVFERIAIGKPPALIAADLGLSVKTVSTYRQRLLEKLEIRSNAEIATLRAQLLLDRAHILFTAATKWAAFQHPDSLEDQKSDVRLRADALEARNALLAVIDQLSTHERDGRRQAG